MSTAVCPFRAAEGNQDGTQFEDYLWGRVDRVARSPQQRRELFRRIWAFIQEYDRLRDESRDQGRRGEPSVSEYALRWRMSERSAYRAFQEFALVMPELGPAPAALCDELANGISRQGAGSRLMALADVRVFEVAA
jgi:hypothetical protein